MQRSLGSRGREHDRDYPRMVMLHEESKEESRLLAPGDCLEGYDLKTELFEVFFKKVESHV